MNKKDGNRDLKILAAVALALLLCSTVSLAAGFFLVRSNQQGENGEESLLGRIIRPIVGDDQAATLGIEEGTGEDRSGQEDGEPGDGTPEDRAPDIGGPEPGATEPSQEATPAPTPVPTVDVPPEICQGDPCTLPVVAPPIEALGSGDCARFTEADVLTPILFEVPREVITDYTPEGDLQLSGDITLETPVGPINLINAELTFERYDPGLAGFERVSGRVEVPSTLMQVSQFGGPVQPGEASLMLARGRDLDHLEAPLCPGRQYIALSLEQDTVVDEDLSQGTSISYELESGGGLIVDPLDPSFQIFGDIPGVGSAGLGRSWLGLLPYSPVTNWGVEDKVIPFTGHLYQSVEDVDLPERIGIPLAVSGIMALDMDPDNNSEVNLAGVTLNPTTAEGLLALLDELVRQNNDFAVGHSGGLSVSIPVPGEIDIQIAGNQLFDFDLVDGSTGIYVTDGASQAYFSGISEQEAIHPLLPLQPVTAMRTAGYLSDQIFDFEIRQEGQYELRAGLLTLEPPIEISPLRVEGSSIANVEGTTFQGTTQSRIHPDIIFEGQAGVEARSAFARPEESYVTMSGDLSMPAIGVSGDSVLTVNAGGLVIAGAFEINADRIVQNQDVSLGNLLVEGTLRPVPGGYSLSGTTSSQIHPLVAAGGQLGVEAFLAANPQQSSITLSGDLQVAGVALANAALEISASGVLIEGNYSTPLNTFRLTGGLTDAGPNLSGSTEVSLPLVQPAGSISGWRVFGQCVPNAEIRSCTIDTFLGSVDGIRHAVTGNACIPFPSGGFEDCRISTPAVSLGELEGSVDLRLGIDGLGGGFGARFCPVTGGCQSLTGGRLLLAAEPQACVTVPAVGEEVCVPF